MAAGAFEQKNQKAVEKRRKDEEGGVVDLTNGLFAGWYKF